MQHLTPSILMIALAIVIFTASVGGFAVGLCVAPYWRKWQIRRAMRRVQTLLNYSVQDLAAAEQTCRLLLERSGLKFNEQELSRFQECKAGLDGVLTAIESAVRDAPLPTREVPAEPPELNWQQAPVFGPSGLPGTSAFEQNVDTLVACVNETGRDGGILLIEIDRFSQLQQRFGSAGATDLSEHVARRTCRQIRDVDIVCQLESNLLAVLLPGIKAEIGRTLAEAIRASISDQMFHVEQKDCEVFVTASLGYAVISPGCDRPFVEEQARAALHRATKLGRNKLHVISARPSPVTQAV